MSLQRSRFIENARRRIHYNGKKYPSGSLAPVSHLCHQNFDRASMSEHTAQSGLIQACLFFVSGIFDRRVATCRIKVSWWLRMQLIALIIPDVMQCAWTARWDQYYPANRRASQQFSQSDVNLPRSASNAGRSCKFFLQCLRAWRTCWCMSLPPHGYITLECTSHNREPRKACDHMMCIERLMLLVKGQGD